MRDLTPTALVERAVKLCTPNSGESGSGRYITALLESPALAGITPTDVLMAAIAAGRAAISTWVQAYPSCNGPVLAIVAAEAWAQAPSPATAEMAALASLTAGEAAIKVWGGAHPNAAWAGRTAAWVAAAPKYGWQAVPALYGACNSIDKKLVVSAVTAALLGSSPGHA